MDDLSKMNHQTQTPEPEPPSPTPVNASMQPPITYRKTAGDIGFDLGVYGGIGYIANAAISMMADRYGTQLPQSGFYKAGQAVEKGFEKTLKHVISDKDAIKRISKKSTQIAFLSSGGWLLLLPMKWLEDRKAGIIQGLDKTLGTTPQTPEALRTQTEALDNGPRQSMTSLFLGRCASYVLTVTAAVPFITDITPVGKDFTLFLNRKLGPYMKESWKTPTMTIEGAKVPKLMNSLAYEIILAGTASVLHYGSSKLFAHAGHQLKQTETASPQTQVEQAEQAGKLENNINLYHGAKAG